MSPIRASLAPSWIAGLPLFGLLALIVGSPGSWTSLVRPVPSGSVAVEETVIAAGTPITIELSRALSTRDSHAGDVFGARVAEPVMVDEHVTVPIGAHVSGHIAAVRPGTMTDARGRIELSFDSMEVDGWTHAVRVRRTLNEALGPDGSPWVGGGVVSGGVTSTAGAGTHSTLSSFHPNDALHLTLAPGTRLVFKLDRDIRVRQPRAS